MVHAAIWPSEFDELKRATSTLAILLHQASGNFMTHAESTANCYFPSKFYKNMGFNPNYDRDVRLYEGWLDQCWRLVREATKAANWFADVVRKEINPMFFAEKGKFMVVEGPFSDLRIQASLPEFTDDEKAALPESLSIHSQD